jgi:hypothetical protein
LRKLVKVIVVHAGYDFIVLETNDGLGSIQRDVEIVINIGFLSTVCLLLRSERVSHGLKARRQHSRRLQIDRAILTNVFGAL